MNILSRIVLHKLGEVEELQKTITIADFKNSPFYSQNVPSLKASLLDPSKNGMIAEFKRKSPSKGVINDKVIVEEVVKGYELAGASGVSVLTDHDFFGGNEADLRAARAAINIPILRKDFIIDEFQIHQAKAMGASAILLIAACLEKETALKLAKVAKDLGLDILMELHDEDDLKVINKYVDIVGVNNRNLQTFEVSLEHSATLSELIPRQFVKISESGIHEASDVEYLRNFGYQGFLIGESFMRTDNPGKACADFASKIKSKK